jgi:cytochrome b subunit of formate dehydrogenase
VKIGGITEILKLDFIKARELQAKVKIQPDDRIGVILGVKANATDPTPINEIKFIERPTNKWRWGIFLIVFIFVIGVFSGISMLLGFKWNAFIVGADNRYSNSKFQIVSWFFALFTIYLTTLVLRIKIYDFDLIGGIGITENLLALSGLSAFTYGSAKAITMSQIENTQEELDHANVQVAAAGDAAALNVQRRIADAAQHKVNLKQHERGRSKWKNLFCNDDDKLDFGDTQMFFITLLAVVIFFVTGFHFLEYVEYTSQITLPDVDTTLLSAFGLGQGAYLAKKVATPLGKG